VRAVTSARSRLHLAVGARGGHSRPPAGHAVQR